MHVKSLIKVESKKKGKKKRKTVAIKRKRGDGGRKKAKGNEWRRRDRALRLPCVRLFLTNCASLVDYTHCHHGNKCLAV